jgi:hypothetical protein
MKKKLKKKNDTPERKITYTFDNGAFTIFLGPSALRHLDRVNKSLRKEREASEQNKK